MEVHKRRFGDRRDGKWLRDEDPLHTFMPYLLQNRTDAEAFVSEQIDITNILAYLEKKNAANPQYKYTLFHVICAAMVKTIALRPKMNRFISGRRLYQRHDISLSFVAKKQFNDDGEESLLFLKFDEDTTIDSLYERIRSEVTEIRKGKNDNSTDVMAILAKLPRRILAIIVGFLRMLDYYGKVPYDLIKEDPNYSSVMLSNLGSIKLNAGYHHLNNWGNNSIFVVVGEKHKAPYYDNQGNVTMRDCLNLGITLDERIADGYYYSKTIKLLKYLLQNPQLLEKPAKEVVDYE